MPSIGRARGLNAARLAIWSGGNGGPPPDPTYTMDSTEITADSSEVTGGLPIRTTIASWNSKFLQLASMRGLTWQV